MDQHLYTDSYQRYKSGTKTVFKWLIDAGRVCGIELAPPSARVAASGGDPEARAGETRRLSLSRYAAIAQAVAACEDPKVEVGSRLLSVLKDVIVLRKAFNAMYELTADVGSSEDNDEKLRKDDGHRFIITVLEDIMDALGPLRVRNSPRQTSVDEHVDEPADWQPDGTIFDVLDVEDVEEPIYSKELMKTATTQQQQQKPQQRTQPRPGKGKKGKGKGKSKGHAVKAGLRYDADDQELSRDDLYFMVFCFFRDLNDIRTHLQGVWAGYRDGEVPLITAAVVTDLALDVMKRRERELIESEVLLCGKKITVEGALEQLIDGPVLTSSALYWRQPFKGSYLGDMLFNHIAAGRVLDSSSMSTEDRDNIVLRQYVLSDWLCIPQFMMLHSVQSSYLDEGHAEAPLKGSDKVYSTEAGSEARVLFNRDARRVESLCAELWQLVMFYKSQPHLEPRIRQHINFDTWTQALQKWLSENQDTAEKAKTGDGKKKKGTKAEAKTIIRPSIPLWLIMGSAIYLDVQSLLGPNLGRAFYELRSFGQEVVSTLKKHQVWGETWKNDKIWEPRNEDVLKKLRKLVEDSIMKDLFFKWANQHMGEKANTSEPNWLMLHHPIWCGTFLMELQLTMWNLGINLCNLWATGIHPLHIYNMAKMMAQKRGEDVVEWEDMEYLLRLHDATYLFYGDRPRNLTDCSTRWQLAMGVSIHELYGPRRNEEHETPRALQMSARGREKATRRLRATILPSQVLSTRYGAACTRDHIQPGHDLGALGMLLQWQRQQGSSTALIRHGEQSSFVVPLLETAAKTLTADHKHYMFDYFDMHRRGWAFLHALQDGLRDELPVAERICHVSLRDHDSETINNLAQYLLRVATSPNVANNPVSGAILPRMCALVRQFANGRGSDGIEAVRKQIKENEPELIGDESSSDT